MSFTFDATQAFDPTDPRIVAANAEITFHAVGDVSLTPLEITDVTGVPLPNPYATNDLGAMPAFVHETLDQVAWSGGGQSGKLTSWEGLRDAAGASRMAAESAAIGAVAAVEGSLSAYTDAVNTSRDAALAAESAAVNAANLVGAPADTAIATAINGPGTQTQTALSAAIGDKIAAIELPGMIIEEPGGYPVRSDAPLAIWRGDTDPRNLPEFRVGIDLWAPSNPPVPVVNKWFTNFSAGTIGTLPAGFTSRWDNATSATVKDAGSGAKMFTIVSGNATVLFSWDVIPASSDVEVVMKYRGTRDPALTETRLLAMAASGSKATRSGYDALLQGEAGAAQLRILDMVNGAVSSYVGNAKVPVPMVTPNTWQWVRMRKYGSTISIRLWADGATEPTTWQISAVDPTPHSTGWAGPMIYLSGTTDVAIIGAAIDGATAPKEIMV